MEQDDIQELQHLFRSYVDDCIMLKESLLDAISDVEHQLSGGVIRYAVDFAEIFNYLIPDQRSHFFNIFSNEMTEEENVVFERLVLRSFFYTVPKRQGGEIVPHILLPPYVAELDGFITQLVNHEFHEIIHSYGAAEKFLASKEYKAIRILIDKPNEELSEDEQNMIRNVLTNNITMLMSVLAIPLMTSSGLKDLLSSGTIVGTDNLSEFPTYVDDRIASWIYQQFLEIRGVTRPTAASRVDAIAMTMVEQINRSYLASGQNARFCLVSRSQNMRMVYNKAKDETIRLSKVLRHPRIFHLLSHMREKRLEQQLDELKHRLTLVNRFLESVIDYYDHQFEADKIRELLRDSLATLSREWTLSSSYFATQAELSEPNRSLYARGISLEMRDLILLLKETESVKRIVDHQLSILANISENRIRGEHATLGFALQSSADDDPELILRDIEIRESKQNNGAIAFRAISFVIPYYLEFYSEAAIHLIRVLKPDPRRGVEWHNVLRFFMAVKDQQPDYELLLLMSYILGAMNKWSLAENYSEQALLEVGETNGSEAYLFCAVCKRRGQPEYERHVHAIKLIDEGIKRKARQLGMPEYVDPRYLVEKSIHILALDIDFSRRMGQGVPGAKYGLELLKRADETCEDEHIRETIALITLGYHVEKSFFTGKLLRRRQLEKYYKEIIETQTNRHGSYEHWSPRHLHVLAIARWALFTVSNEDKKEIVGWLDKALSAPTLSGSRKSRIRKQRRMIIEDKKVLSY